jgi:hypothetical protein
MAKTSFIVPSRNEIATIEGINVLQRTVKDIYEKATGDFEVIVGFDGPPYQDFPDYPNIRTLKLPDVIGIKNNINLLAILAKGKYLFKLDAHCSVSKGIDEILQADMQDNWVVMPRFYVLSNNAWQWQDDRHYDYFFLPSPFSDPRGFRFKAGGHWPERTAERENKPEYMIDETPQIHGSGWFMDRDFFLNKIGGFPVKDPYGHAQEPATLGLKTWLGPWDGKVMVNKKTWYAHLHQSRNSKGFALGSNNEENTYHIIAKYWLYNEWEERKHDFEWFIDEKFPNMPTWSPDWKERFANFRKEHPEYDR